MEVDNRDREMPEGVQRKPLRLHRSVRDYLRKRTEGSSQTFSQELNSYLPENWDEIEFGYSNDDIAYTKVTPDTKARITSMTGQNVSQGDVVSLFVMLAALDNGDLEEASDIALDTPELIWDMLNGLSDSILEVKESADD